MSLVPVKTVAEQAATVIVKHREPLVGQRTQAICRVLRCLIGMEACADAHDWARRLRELGHDVRLMPPSCVKPYVECGKTNAAAAAAIREAVIRPSMRFISPSRAKPVHRFWWFTARGTFWFVSARRSETRSGPT